MRTFATHTLTALLLAGLQVNAADLRTENPYNKVFANIAAPEYPAKAAAEVKQAGASKQASVTILVVRAALGLRPASAPAVAAAIAREVPEMALAAASDGERHVLIHPDDLAAFLKVHHDLTFVFF